MRFYYNTNCFPQKLRFCAICVEINIQIHALRHEFLCIRKANTDDGYAVYIYYNTIKCFAFNCYSKTRKRFIAALPQSDCEAIRKAVFQ